MVNQRIEQLKKERDEYKEALIQCRKHQLIDNGLNNCQAYRKAKEDVENMKGNRNETD